MCTSVLWEQQCAALRDVACCLPLDLRTGNSMSAMAHSVLERAPERFSLAALSMGGHVAMEMLRQAPQRIERLALIDTRATVDSPDRLKAREGDEVLLREHGLSALIAQFPSRWLSAEHATRSELRQKVIDMAHAVGIKVREQQRQALLNRIDSRASLSQVTCPTLIMCGEDDQPNPVWMHHEMTKLIPGAHLRVLAGCGHLSPIEQPQEVSNALREWLHW
jgi:pimeloyl-ACP methyl ester carboxylesterase